MNKIVIITGGSSGIGKACAMVYAQRGYHVIITGRNNENLKNAAKEIASFGGEVLDINVDANSAEGAEKVIDQTIAKFGQIDILICNAGITMRALFEDLDLAVFKDVMEVNFMGAVYYVKYALPHILQSKGSIIGISSINGHRGTPARTAYTASKFALEGFFEALRSEVMYRGVHVLVVSPGYTGTNIRNTALTAHGQVQGESPRDESKMMTAEQVAKIIYKGQVNKKRDIVLTPLGWWLNFLNKFMPSMMDWIVYKVLSKEAGTPLK